MGINDRVQFECQGEWLLVEPDLPRQSAGGLALPEMGGSTKRMEIFNQLATVLSVGPGLPKGHKDYQEAPCKAGDRICYEFVPSSRCDFYEKKYMMLTFTNVMAVVRNEDPGTVQSINDKQRHPLLNHE